jgi:hypothetical protein
MLGLPGHNEIMRFEEVLSLVKGGQLRPTDLVKKLGEPWKAANEIPELMDYFDPKKAATIPAPPKAEPPKEASRPPSVVQKAPPPPPPPAPAKAPEPPPRVPARPTTARAPSTPPAPAPKPAAPPARPAAEAPKGETRPPEMLKGDSRPPEVPKGDSRRPEVPKADTRPPEGAKPEPPPVESAKAETKPPEPEKETPEARPASPKAAEETKAEQTDEKPKAGESRLRAGRTRPVPKPPPREEPRIEPMVGKYLGPVDLLRCASFAFDPRKLLLVGVGVAAMGVLTGLLWHLSGSRSNPREWAMAIAAGAVWIFGLSYISVTLAYVTRRQIEGKEYALHEMVRAGAMNALLSVVNPALAIVPSLVSLLFLYGLGFLRNSGSGGASFVKIAYFIPMAFAFLAMAGAIIYQLAIMYVPAAAAIEGTRVAPSVTAAWNTIRGQWGRVVLHWLIITVAVGVISVVGLFLALGAIWLPNQIFPTTENINVFEAWNNFSHLFSIYEGLAIGLGLTLPVSLLSTLGTLSYVSLRHPASAQLSPSSMDETSGIHVGPSGTRTGSNPAEATQPGETRPASPDATRPGPGATPPPSDITDDSDEQPLVKD